MRQSAPRHPAGEPRPVPAGLLPSCSRRRWFRSSCAALHRAYLPGAPGRTAGPAMPGTLPLPSTTVPDIDVDVSAAGEGLRLAAVPTAGNAIAAWRPRPAAAAPDLAGPVPPGRGAMVDGAQAGRSASRARRVIVHLYGWLGSER